MKKDAIRKDLEIYGIGEILAQYMSNSFAEELTLEFIRNLQKENACLKEENERF